MCFDSEVISATGNKTRHCVGFLRNFGCYNDILINTLIVVHSIVINGLSTVTATIEPSKRNLACHSVFIVPG